MKIAVIGAGAAGCFAAIQIKRQCPKADVSVYEGGGKALAKVAVTGGGRCNLTNTFEDVKNLASVYPRGERLMKRLLKVFGWRDVYKWFENEGVPLIIQPDKRVFPASENALDIVDTLLRIMKQTGVRLLLKHRVTSVTRVDSVFRLGFSSKEQNPVEADKILVTIGGCPKPEQLNIAKYFNLEIIPPVPSLFSLCLPHHPVTELPGVTVEQAGVSLAGTRFKSTGPLLITHWGVSGPSILRLSSYAARYLSECHYKARLVVNWLGESTEQNVAETIRLLASGNRLKQLQHAYPRELNSRLWLFILQESGLSPSMRWADLGKKGLNRLVAVLTGNTLQVDGKNRFKDEFVTCGGIGLANVNPNTLECRTCEGLYFAGEVLDVDAVTGGFNLQAAWTMGYVAAESIIASYSK